MNEAILLENRTYWSHRAPSYSEVNREELATHQHAVWKQVLTEQISACFPGRTPDRIHILEIGTGPGFFAILLAEVGYRVTAIDLTPSMLEEARSNAGNCEIGCEKRNKCVETIVRICYNKTDNRIHGYSQVPDRLRTGKKAGDWENRERSASLRQDRCCEAEPKPFTIDRKIEKGPRR